MLKKLAGRLTAWIRIRIGLKFIRCSRPDDILVISRFGDQKEWEYTLEQVAQVITECGHPHNIVFGDAEFVTKNVRQLTNQDRPSNKSSID